MKVRLWRVSRRMPGELAGAQEVVEVGPGVVAACGALAVGGDRLPAHPVRALGEVEAPAALGVLHQRGAVTGQARGGGAVEEVHPLPDRVDDVVNVADAQQVPRAVVALQRAQRPLHHLTHLVLRLAEGPADGYPVHGSARSRRRWTRRAGPRTRLPARCRRSSGAPGACSPCQAMQRSSQRCVRSMEAAV